MVTSLPRTGAAGAVIDTSVVGAAVVATGRDWEQPANANTPAAGTIAKHLRSMGISMPRDTAVGYTAQAGRSGRGGANTSMLPLASRTINAGKGFGAIGN
jgi:hypothetical protein